MFLLLSCAPCKAVHVFTMYIKTQVILTFWLVGSRLWSIRCTIDITTIKFFLLCFKMVESFEKLDTVIFYLIGKKISTKCICEALNRYIYEKHSRARRRKIKLFLSLKNGSKKYLTSRQSSETVPSHAKLVLVNCEPLPALSWI